MASNYKENHTVTVKGILNLEDKIIEVKDFEPIKIDEIFSKFNGCAISLTVQLTNELDK